SLSSRCLLPWRSHWLCRRSAACIERPASCDLLRPRQLPQRVSVEKPNKKGNAICRLLVSHSGILAGWIAGHLMGGRGYGVLGDLVLGIIGAIVGGWLAGLVLGQDLVSGFNPLSLIVAVVGAVIVVAIYRPLTGSRSHA